MGDIGEGPAMDQGWIAFQGLYKIRFKRLLQEGRHRPFSLQIRAGDGAVVLPEGDDDGTQPRLKVCQICCQAKDRHHFRRDRDVKARFNWLAITAERCDDRTKGAVIHVHHPTPSHFARINPKSIAPIKVIIDHGRQQVMGGCNGVKVAREMEIDLVHRDNLGVPATRRTTFLAKAGTK